jgi:hypothetical protein
VKRALGEGGHPCRYLAGQLGRHQYVLDDGNCTISNTAIVLEAVSSFLSVRAKHVMRDDAIAGWWLRPHRTIWGNK